MLARLLGCGCLVLGLVAIILSPALASEPRIALVIGNSAYGPSIGKLKNPANDAKLMAETLKGLGFSVDLVLDADQKAMKRAVKGFGAKLRESGSEATGLFYYAGHGVQVEGTNFLLPVGAEIAAEADVEIESISADDVMTQMQSAGNAVNLVFLDACRNNPLARTSRSATRGLARLDAPRGSFVGYSTAPGDVAADGDGANSPYALALAEELRRPGISVEEAHRNVRARVLAATGDAQTPWDSSSLTAPVILAAKAGVVEPPAPSAVGSASVDREALFWDTIKTSANAADFEAYLKQYPAGTFADLARNKIAALKPESAAAGAAVEIEELDATFVAKQAANVRASPSTEAEILFRLAADDAVVITGRVKGKDWLRVSVKSGAGYVSAPLLAQVDAAALADWQALPDPPRSDDLKAFLAKHPEGHFAARAETSLAALAPAPDAAAEPAAAEPEVTDEAAPSTAAAALAPGQAFRDCADCPELVVIPPGSFVMGSPATEQPRHDNEGPQHTVTVPTMFAVGKFEVTLAEFRRFAAATGYVAGSECWIDIGGDGEWERRTDYSWDRPDILGYPQTERDPAVCVTWGAARAYVDWLSEVTGKPYRLLSEAEWEYVARGGSGARFFWGDSDAVACKASNGADAGVREHSWYPSEWGTLPCKDGYVYTAPVGSYRANEFGLHDVLGNAWEWVADCYSPTYAAASAGGAATDGGCTHRVRRGGGWNNNQWAMRSATRGWANPGVTLADHGFRVARDL